MRREAIYTTFSATMRVRDSPREGEIWSREEAATVSMVARIFFSRRHCRLFACRDSLSVRAARPAGYWHLLPCARTL